jgi:uncharacterized membrane protein YjdF
VKAPRALRPFDLFATLNVVLLALMAVFSYYRFFVRFRGEDNVIEFLLYAVLVGVVLAALWRGLRELPVRPMLLVLVEIGILLHFAGGLLHIHGFRLYEIPLVDLPGLDFRFDKIVHFTNALIGCLTVGALFRVFRIRLGALAGFTTVLVVLGLGTIWELVEYLAVRTLPVTGVGGHFDRLYDNNMQDLIANLCGGLAFLLVPASWRRRLGADTVGPEQTGTDSAERRGSESHGKEG